MRRLTKHWSRLAIASSGVDGLVGCERLYAVVRQQEAQSQSNVRVTPGVIAERSGPIAVTQAVPVAVE